MPALNGFIPLVQSQKLLKTDKLSSLEYCTIGIDAWKYFQNYIIPSSSNILAGTIDYKSVEMIILQHLHAFTLLHITPIFVFTGFGQSNRITQLDSILNKDNTSNTNSTSSSILPGDISWKIDESECVSRDACWNDLSSGRVEQCNTTATTQIRPNISYEYCDVIRIILQQYNSHVIIAPYSVSAQLAILASSSSSQQQHEQSESSPYVHAVYGYTDIFLFTHTTLLHTLPMLDGVTGTYQHITLSSVLSSLSITHVQFIESCILGGYKQSVSHPLSLDSKGKYNLINAINIIITHKTLEYALLHWSITFDPKTPPPAKLLNPSLKLKKQPSPQSIKIEYLNAINNTIQYIYGAQGLYTNGGINTLYTTYLTPLLNTQKIASATVKTFEQIKTQHNNDTTQQYLLSPVVPLPSIQLPSSLTMALCSGAVSPLSLTTIITGRLLDHTYHIPSTNLDSVLDWANTNLRGPAIYGLISALYHQSENGTISPQWSALYKSIGKYPIVLNDRYNDQQNGIWSRDIIAKLDQSGQCKIYNDSNIFTKKQIDTFIDITKRKHTITSHHITHPLYLLSSLSHSSDNNTVHQQLSTSELYIALSILYILFFLRLIDQNGCITSIGHELVQTLPAIPLSEYNNNIPMMDTMFYSFIASQSGLLGSKYLDLSKSDLRSRTKMTTKLSSQDSTEQTHHIISSIMSLHSDIVNPLSPCVNPNILSETSIKLFNHELCALSYIGSHIRNILSYTYNIILASIFVYDIDNNDLDLSIFITQTPVGSYISSPSPAMVSHHYSALKSPLQNDQERSNTIVKFARYIEPFVSFLGKNKAIDAPSNFNDVVLSLSSQ